MEPTLEPQKKTSAWRISLQLLIAYLVGAWTFLQFLEWFLDRVGVSSYWVDVFLWLNIGLIPSILIYFWHRRRINTGQVKRWEKIFLGVNVLLLSVAMIFGLGSKGPESKTKEVTLLNAAGEEVSQRIVKQEYRQLCYVFNFEPKDGEAAEEQQWLGDGIKELLTLDMKQDRAVNLQEVNNTFSAAEKIKESKLGKYFVDGYYTHTDGQYVIEPVIHQAGTGRVIDRRPFTGTDLYALIDSMSVYVRDKIGVSLDDQLFSADLPLREYTTDSLSALRYFCQSTMGGWAMALEVDPDFTLAEYYLGRFYLLTGRNATDERIRLGRAFAGRGELPLDLSHQVLSSWHLANNDLAAAEASLKIQLEIEPDNEALNEEMLLVLSRDKRFGEVLDYAKELYERNFSEFALYKYMEALKVNNQPNEILGVINPLLLKQPTDPFLLDLSFKAKLMKRDWKAAAKTLDRIDAAYPEYKQQLRYYHRWLERRTAAQGKMEGGEEFIGRYQFFGGEKKFDFQYGPEGGIFLTGFSGAINQTNVAAKDTLYATYMTGFKNFAVITPEQNSTGKTSGVNIIDFERTEGNKRGPIYYPIYKSSDAHEAAERYLRAGQYAEAEAAYREALVDYPDHFFLEDALEHLAYRKSLSPEAYTTQLEVVAGRYEDRKFWVEDGRLLYKRDPIVNRVWTTLELLPISAGTYVNLSKKNTRLLFEFEEGEPVASGAEIYDTNISKWVNTAIANPKDRKLRNPDQ